MLLKHQWELHVLKLCRPMYEHAHLQAAPLHVPTNCFFPFAHFLFAFLIFTELMQKSPTFNLQCNLAVVLMAQVQFHR